MYEGPGCLRSDWGAPATGVAMNSVDNNTKLETGGFQEGTLSRECGRSPARHPIYQLTGLASVNM
jgi:hypothetical protein